MAGEAGASNSSVPGSDNVKVKLEDGIALVKLNRPRKRKRDERGARAEKNQVLDALELDDRCGVLVLSGEGEVFSAGMGLRDFFRTRTLAKTLLGKNPAVRRAAKLSYKYIREMTWEEAAEYLTAKNDQTTIVDPCSRERGISEFRDSKTYEPGLGNYPR